MWFSVDARQARISIFAKPNSRQTALVGVDDRWLTVALQAPPADGKANSELIAWLSALLSVPKSKIILLKGKNSRYKQLSLPVTSNVQAFLNDPLNFFSGRRGIQNK